MAKCGFSSGRPQCRLLAIAILVALTWGMWQATAVSAATVGKVRVPRILGQDVVSAYNRLHAAGLRVSIPRWFGFDSRALPTVALASPRPGRRVAKGSVVTLYLVPRAAAAVAPPRHRPAYRVPRFSGAQVSTAYAWVKTKRLIFDAYLAPLHGANAPGLLANYQVTHQRPAPGVRLALGKRKKAGFRQTPLSVWGAPRPPTAVTGAAGAITLTSSTVNGTVNPNGEATSYYFSYGPTTAYGSRSPLQQAGFGNSSLRTTSSLAGLSPVTTYHYRLVATSKAGTTFGSDQTFTTAGYYKNPVYGPAAFPDPFVLDNGGQHSDYWAYGTGDRFPVLHSTDLVHWTAQGTAMTARPAWVTSASDWHPWAPSVLRIPGPCPGTTSNGCYVMYYVGLSAQMNVNCVAVATATTPGGPFADQGPLQLTNAPSGSTPLGCGDAAGKGNIDPSPFIDPSGQAYLYTSTDFSCSGGSCTLKPTISVIPLAPDFLHAAGPRTPLFSGTAGTWEASGVQAPTVEGPSMELHNGTYYLLYSGGSWHGAYGMGYATSTSPTGPFTKASTNPILAQTSAVLSPGGGDAVVTGPHGALWMVYHGRAQPDPAPRTLRLDRFGWAPATKPGVPGAPVISGPTATPQPNQP